MSEIKCHACKIRPAMKDDTLCKECSERYAARLRSAIGKTKQVSSQLLPLIQRGKITSGASHEKPPRMLRLGTPRLVGFFLLGIGFLALTISILVTSTILTFIGLGLAFWGVLMFFIQAHNYVRSDLLKATALSSLKAIDKMIVGLNYHERSVYIPSEGFNRALAFIPSAASSKIPQNTFDEKTFLGDPEGLLVIPPGLALSNLVESKLGFNLKDCGLESLINTLPSVLVEDLEVVRDVEIEVKGDYVLVRLVDSVFADLCQEVSKNSGGLGLGCPMCSALACILTSATSKAIILEESKSSADTKTTESSYRILK